MEIFIDDAEIWSPPEAFSRGVAVVYLLGSGLPAKPRVAFRTFSVSLVAHGENPSTFVHKSRPASAKGWTSQGQGGESESKRQELFLQIKRTCAQGEHTQGRTRTIHAHLSSDGLRRERVVASHHHHLQGAPCENNESGGGGTATIKNESHFAT